MFKCTWFTFHILIKRLQSEWLMTLYLDRWSRSLSIGMWPIQPHFRFVLEYFKRPGRDAGDLNLVPMRSRAKPYLDSPHTPSWRGQKQIYLDIDFILLAYQLSIHAFAPNIFSPLEHVGCYVYSLLKVIYISTFSPQILCMGCISLPEQAVIISRNSFK
jgi:hypothetical protein